MRYNYENMPKVDMDKLVALTKENVRDFIGKRIYFYSRQYKANYDAEGVVTITDVDFSQELPITCEIEMGFETGLVYARCGRDEFWLGDCDRTVMVAAL